MTKTAEIKDPSATDARTCPTCRLGLGTNRLTPKKLTK